MSIEEWINEIEDDFGRNKVNYNRFIYSYIGSYFRIRMMWKFTIRARIYDFWAGRGRKIDSLTCQLNRLDHWLIFFHLEFNILKFHPRIMCTDRFVSRNERSNNRYPIFRTTPSGVCNFFFKKENERIFRSYQEEIKSVEDQFWIVDRFRFEYRSRPVNWRDFRSRCSY